jgi:predicted secreted Zn-dependent protease
MKTFVTLLLISLAVTAFAAENSVELVSIKRTPASRAGNHPLPPLVTESYEYYDVCGCCEEDLKCDLKKKCITWKDGNKYDSLTTWDVKWDYAYDLDSGSCLSDSFRATVHITFRYPRWIPTDDAPPSLVEKWDNYLSSLTHHENGHRDRVVAAAADLSRDVAQLPPSMTCAELDRQIQSLSRKRLEMMKENQRNYDDMTKHGAAQGAVFP